MNLIQKAIICRAGFEDIQLKFACVRGMGFCYAVIGIIKSSSQESCLSRIPSATAGTFFVVK
jgi:hypothetical protein